jgi:hypothetical protein
MPPEKRRNVLRSIILSLVALAAIVVPVGPAQAAWTAQIPVTIQVVAYHPSGTTQTVGRVEGWVQLDDGGSAFRYSFTFCRQSSYQSPRMSISVNVSNHGGQRWATPIASVFPPYSGESSTQPCYGSTATVASEHSYPNFSNVEFQLFGSTFIGQSHTIFMQDRLIYNPY